MNFVCTLSLLCRIICHKPTVFPDILLAFSDKDMLLGKLLTSVVIQGGEVSEKDDAGLSNIKKNNITYFTDKSYEFTVLNWNTIYDIIS